MNAILPRKPARRSTGFGGGRSLSRAMIGAALMGLAALFVGLFAAVMPPSMTARLAFLVVAGLVGLLALLLGTGVVAPGHSMRRLLYAWIVISVAWPHYLAYRGLPGPAVNPIRAVYWLLLAVWFFWLIGSREMRALLAERLRAIRPFAFLLLGYLIWSVICAAFSAAPFFSIYHFIKTMGGPVLIFLIALSCLRDERDLDFAFLLLVLAALAAVAVGLIEALAQRNVFYGLVPSLFPQGGEGELAWAEQLIRDKSRDGKYRVMATFVHPLTFGEYLALCFPLAMFLAGFAMQGFRRLLGLLALPLLVAGIYLSHTRSTLLALGVVLVGLVATLGLRAMRQRRSMSLSVAGFFVLAAVPIAALALGAIALELSSGRTSGEIGSSVARLTMFRYGAQAVIEQPLLGYGPGFAAVTIGLLPGFTALTVDSYYLSVALESGVPGLLFFAALLVYTVINGLIASTRRGGTAGARLAVLAVTLSGFAVVKLVLSQPDNMAAAFLLIALLFVAMERRRGSSPSAASFVPPTSGRPQGAAGAGHPIPR